MKTILIVEDDRLTCFLLQEAFALFSNDNNVLIAGDGGEALGIMEKEQIDVILTDIMMPVMDGFELIAAVRAQNKDIPIYVMTSYSPSLMEERLGGAGHHRLFPETLRPSNDDLPDQPVPFAERRRTEQWTDNRRDTGALKGTPVARRPSSSGGRCWSSSRASSCGGSSRPSKAASSTSIRSHLRRREKIRRICRRLVGYDPISRGVRASALDVWNRLYRDEYGVVPEGDGRENVQPQTRGDHEVIQE